MVNISFITVNYNSSKYTIELIESIKKYTTLSYEIIVVDNDSYNKDRQNIENFCLKEKDVIFVKNAKNEGFASGNMLGAKKAKGKYLFFINNDTKLLNDTSYYLYNFLENNKKVALATAQIRDENGTFSSSYKLFPSLTKELLGNTIARIFNKFPTNKIILKEPTKVEVVSGSCMFFRKEVFEKIGGFDTNFFLYCEEEDISKRIWNSGYKVCFVPTAKIYHKGGGSSSQKFNLIKEYYISYKYLIFKHFNFFKASVLYLLVCYKILRRSLTKKDYRKLIFYMILGFNNRYSLRGKIL